MSLINFRNASALALAWFAAAGTPPVLGAPIAFHSAVSNAPLVLDLRPGDTLTDAMKQFYATGENPYRGQAAALARGQELFDEFCQVCHMPDGSGRIGPSLIDEKYINPRANTDVGRFEILMGGAFGAMRSFYDRMSQDEMLKVLAYVHALGRAAKAPARS
jgi:cytochrome c-L